MKNIIKLTLILFLLAYESNAQNIKVTYNYSAASGRLEHQPTLLISKENSQFHVDYDDRTMKYNASTLNFKGQTYVINYEYATKEFTELKYLDDNEVKASWINDQEWEILDETKTILDYSVRKAKKNSGDQIMYAWFTTEIPVKTEPFRHAGLPGLILEFSYSRSNSKCIAENIEFNVDKDLKDFSKAFEITKAELNNLKNNKEVIRKRIQEAY